MKFKIHFTLLLFLSLLTRSFSQIGTPASKIIYLDSTWIESTEDNYKYIRVVEEYYSNKDLYAFKDYYKSKVLKTIGFTTDKDILKLKGQLVNYYENGNRKSTVNYLENKKTGKEFNWYENGTLKAELEYIPTKNEGDLNFKVNNYWTEEKEHKVISGSGDLYYKDEYTEESGKVKNGLPDGIWKGKNLKGKYSFTENYENGKFVSGISVDSLNIEHSYNVIKKSPEPKNGMKSFYSYVSKSLYIPAEARSNVSGKIYLTFVIDEDGNLTEPKVIKGVGYGIDEKAIRVIKNAKKWNPGTKRGIPTSARYSLPITIVKNGR